MMTSAMELQVRRGRGILMEQVTTTAAKSQHLLKSTTLRGGETLVGYDT